jgi:hypothetical protein
VYTRQRGYEAPAVASLAEWQEYRQRMLAALRDLLGMHVAIPRDSGEPKELGRQTEGELLIQRVGYPSEGGILVPTIVIRRKQTEGRLPVVMVFSQAGKESLMSESGADSPRQLAQDGSLVVLPDVRCYGEMLSTGGTDTNLQRRAWQRNGIVWGRPVPGMACTDMQGVLDGLAARPDADVSRVKLISRKSGDLAIAALFAAAVDPRVTSADVDFHGGCFQKRNLPLVCAVLQYGDVLQWAALAADRKLTLRNVPPEAGDPAWLRTVFAAAGNRDGLRVN